MLLDKNFNPLSESLERVLSTHAIILLCVEQRVCWAESWVSIRQQRRAELQSKIKQEIPSTLFFWVKNRVSTHFNLYFCQCTEIKFLLQKLFQPNLLSLAYRRHRCIGLPNKINKKIEDKKSLINYLILHSWTLHQWRCMLRDVWLKSRCLNTLHW